MNAEDEIILGERSYSLVVENDTSKTFKTAPELTLGRNGFVKPL